jgi:hypothetical protein
MHSRVTIIFVLVSGACNAQSDVGQSCPVEAPAADSNSAASVSYPSIIEVNTGFSCDSLTCVSTAGREGYCTQECLSDQSCPSAFECRVVMQGGPMAGRRFCVWRSCWVQLQCGDVSTYDCISGNYGLEAPPGLCGRVEGS